MTKPLLARALALSIAVMLAASSCRSIDSDEGHAERGRARIAHDVFFWLKEDAVGRSDAIVAGCQELRRIPGVVHLTVGQRDAAQTRDVNDQDYHVGLHVEFTGQEAYDVYSPHPIHQALLEEFGDTFERVVVYDTRLGE